MARTLQIQRTRDEHTILKCKFDRFSRIVQCFDFETVVHTEYPSRLSIFHENREYRVSNDRKQEAKSAYTDLPRASSYITCTMYTLELSGSRSVVRYYLSKRRHGKGQTQSSVDGAVHEIVSRTRGGRIRAPREVGQETRHISPPVFGYRPR